ncbi:MAG: hypothetical protein RSC08_04870 [Oscillospiraceae bacterium]
MLESTAHRTQLVLRKVKGIRRRRENRKVAGLSAVCLLVLVFLGSAAQSIAGSTADVSGLFGSVLLHEGAGGYVLAGLIAFAAGVVITLLCIKSKHKKD